LTTDVVVANRWPISQGRLGCQVNAENDANLAVRWRSARYEDKAHRADHQKPISADTLRVRLGIGATPARRLVKIVRAEFEANGAPEETSSTHEVQNADAALSA
jgi:hypothetical protein